MEEQFYDQEFHSKHQSSLVKGEYEACRFNDFDLKSNDLSDYKFLDCEFTNCDLSRVKLNNTSLQTCLFKNCQLIETHFNSCNDFLFEVAFESCNLTSSGFYGLAMPSVRLINCRLIGVDFEHCDLSQANFDGSDLSGAIFSETDLMKADLSNAVHYSIDPDKNTIRRAKFSVHGLPGLLQKHQIQIVDQ